MYKISLRLVLIIIIYLLVSCQRNPSPLVEQRFLLGSPLLIQVFEGGDKALLDTIFSKIQDIEQAMSTSTKDYTTSEILDINATSRGRHTDERNTFTLSNDITNVMSSALYIAKLTRGAFDPSIRPLVSLWGFGSNDERDEARVPSISMIQTILPHIDWSLISVDETSRTLTMQGGQEIDVGGIAKGYAANLARQQLLEAGVASAIIDFGGNIITIGKKQNGKLWRIGIQEPFAPLGTVLMTLDTTERAIVTSGIYERYFESDGVQYSHLIDSHTGYPISNNLLSVTIVSKDSMLADGLSTGIFILGAKEGLKTIETIPEAEAIFVTKDKKIIVSSGLSEGQVEVRNKAYTLENESNSRTSE